MARVLAIDYGKKRTGIAVTDPLQIIASGLTTVDSLKLIPFLKEYCIREQVELIIVGDPRNLDDSPTHGTPLVQRLLRQLKNALPNIPVITVDERYTSKMASMAMLDMGMKKKQRRDKSLIDEIAATIMLQEWLSQGKSER